MTAHTLAKALLAGPDLPVIINGWGSAEGTAYEVAETLQETDTFETLAPLPPGQVTVTVPCERDHLGYPLQRPCIRLIEWTTTNKRQHHD
jgi:hypothetical protein